MIELNQNYVNTKISRNKVNSFGYIIHHRNCFVDRTLVKCRFFGATDYGIISCSDVLIPDKYIGKKFRIKMELVDDE